MTESVKRPGVGKETEAIRYMIHQRLKTHAPVELLPDELVAHLDEDAICAFVEGRLQQTESLTIISHLVACAFCRRTTAQLIRLESQFDPDIESTSPDEGPGRISLFLERMASNLTPSVEEDAVFAYQNPDTEPGQDTPGTQTHTGELEQTESTTNSEHDTESNQ